MHAVMPRHGVYFVLGAEGTWYGHRKDVGMPCRRSLFSLILTAQLCSASEKSILRGIDDAPACASVSGSRVLSFLAISTPPGPRDRFQARPANRLAALFANAEFIAANAH